MKNILILLLGIISFHFAQAQNALLIPPTQSGTNINLTLQNGTHQFYPGQTTATMGANGNILGPTLILNQGEFVNFSVDNQLTDTTTIHWHGLHVSSENDGGPHTVIPPNTIWSPSFTILDKAATYWYHPHLHQKTDLHVSKGISGFIIVKDKDEETLSLPRTYGIDDFPLAIQTKDFDANNQIVAHSNSDDVIMVNATINPYLNVPSQIVRFRVLNGSSQRVFNIGLSNNLSFYQIASDGGLLSVPFSTTRLTLAPGERAELLIDFTGKNGQTIYLKSYSSELSNGIYGATNPGMMSMMSLTGYNPNSLNGSDFNIIQFNVGAQSTSPITTVPSNLVTLIPLSAASSNITRTLTFSPVAMGPNQLNGEFLINNTSFNHSTINYNIPLNNTEIWQLTNQSGIAHPFHIHDVQFFILSRNGNAPPINEQGRKDVVLVKPQETVRFIAKFEDFANTNVPYMYHCHMLKHEDGGMMGQFIVSPPLSLADASNDFQILIYPNPSIESVIIRTNDQEKINGIKFYDLLGRKIEVGELTYKVDEVYVNGLPKGLIFIQLDIGGRLITKKLIIN